MRVFGPYYKTNWITGAAEHVTPTTFDYVHAAIKLAMYTRDGTLPMCLQMTPETARRVYRVMRERSGPSIDMEYPPKTVLGVPIEIMSAFDPEPFRLQYEGGMLLAADVEPNCLPPFTYSQVSA